MNADSALRFTLPVILENILTSAAGLLYSAVVGGISASSLAAAGTGNQAINFVVSAFCAVTTGSAVLTARLTGQGDQNGASRVVEHTMLIAPILSAVITAVLLATSTPVMRFLMPGAEAAFFEEGAAYYRAVLLSLPGLVTMNALAGILRASGESRMALLCSLATNGVQLAAAYLFVGGLNMGVVGAGYAFVACRYAGALALTFAVMGHHRGFRVDRRRLLHPSLSRAGHILRVGAPASGDALAVQGGYVLSNTILIGLGAYSASVYNVLATLTSLSGICQNVTNVATTTLVGQKIGAGDVESARRAQKRIMLAGMACTTALCAPMLVFPGFFAGLFTKDPAVAAGSAALMWLLILYGIPAVGVNCAETAARVGGEARYVMISCTACIWLIRVPLTYLFCGALNMGAAGVFLANIAALFARTIAAYIQVRKPRWGKTIL